MRIQKWEPKVWLLVMGDCCRDSNNYLITIWLENVTPEEYTLALRGWYRLWLKLSCISGISFIFWVYYLCVARTSLRIACWEATVSVRTLQRWSPGVSHERWPPCARARSRLCARSEQHWPDINNCQNWNHLLVTEEGKRPLARICWMSEFITRQRIPFTEVKRPRLITGWLCPQQTFRSSFCCRDFWVRYFPCCVFARCLVSSIYMLDCSVMMFAVCLISIINMLDCSFMMFACTGMVLIVTGCSFWWNIDCFDSCVPFYVRTYSYNCTFCC